jgi:catechol 2,3-dioxygenase-like lactoylglutathione lyase family enzyme
MNSPNNSERPQGVACRLWPAAALTGPAGGGTVTMVHHSAICVRDVEESLRFWRDGLGLAVLMDQRFRGDWPTLLEAPSDSLRAVFLGDPAAADAGIVELVGLGSLPGPLEAAPPRSGFLLLSVFTDVEAALGRLAALDLGGTPRRVEVSGVAMAVVRDPDGVLVELVESGASAHLEQLAPR